MRLFLRSHLSLFFLTLVQGIFVFGYFWFLGFQSLDHLLYIFFMQAVSAALYLAYRWIQDAKLYRWIQDDVRDEPLVPRLGSSSLAEALYERLDRQVQAYEKKTQQVQSELQQKVTFMNQWVHQMKTPLSVIHLMIQDHDDPVFQHIRKELYRLEDGLKTVLYSSRLSMFEKDYSIERVSLQTLMNDVIAENKRLFIKSQIRPETRFPEEPVYVYTDKKWLQFAIGQLISNAVKYSAQKSNTIRIRIETRERQRALVIQDFGIGIPPQDVKRVFEPYFTGVNGRLHHESTGMGLYLAKEILGKLQHEVSLESEVGKGTTVTVLFSDAPYRG